MCETKIGLRRGGHDENLLKISYHIFSALPTKFLTENNLTAYKIVEKFKLHLGFSQKQKLFLFKNNFHANNSFSLKIPCSKISYYQRGNFVDGSGITCRKNFWSKTWKT